MSGRWEEHNTPFTCLIDLVEAAENLNGFSLDVIPDELRRLNNAEKNLTKLSHEIGIAMQNLDTDAVKIASEILDDDSKSLSKYRSEMEELSNIASGELESISQLFDQYKAEERIFENSLHKINQVKSVNLNTPNGSKTLEMKHGRYRYSEYVDDYNGNRGDLGWLNSLSSAYSEVGSTRRNELKKNLSTTSREINRVQISLKNRVARAREETSKAADEELRRQRDKEVMNVAKKSGFRVTRKQVGKKVQYALVRQR